MHSYSLDEYELDAVGRMTTHADYITRLNEIMEVPKEFLRFPADEVWSTPTLKIFPDKTEIEGIINRWPDAILRTNNNATALKFIGNS